MDGRQRQWSDGQTREDEGRRGTKGMTKEEWIKNSAKTHQNSQGCTKCSEAYLDCVQEKISSWRGCRQVFSPAILPSGERQGIL